MPIVMAGNSSWRNRLRRFRLAPIMAQELGEGGSNETLRWM